jgi:hypothetical protein
VNSDIVTAARSHVALRNQRGGADNGSLNHGQRVIDHDKRNVFFNRIGRRRRRRR